MHSSPGASRAGAVDELVERDAFVRWWYGFTTARELRPDDIEMHCHFTDLTDAGWTVRVHRLPAQGQSDVALVSLWKMHRGSASAVVVGCASKAVTTSDKDPMPGVSRRALDEAIQALDVFGVNQAMGMAPLGPLAEFLTPAGAEQILQRLPISAKGSDYRGEGTAAFDEVFTRTTRLVGSPMWFTRALSADALPFPLPGKGRRLQHPRLFELVGRAGMIIDDLPTRNHPLG
jgi:hypothetical protein